MQRTGECWRLHYKLHWANLSISPLGPLPRPLPCPTHLRLPLQDPLQCPREPILPTADWSLHLPSCLWWDGLCPSSELHRVCSKHFSPSTCQYGSCPSASLHYSQPPRRLHAHPAWRSAHWPLQLWFSVSLLWLSELACRSY